MGLGFLPITFQSYLGYFLSGTIPPALVLFLLLVGYAIAVIVCRCKDAKLPNCNLEFFIENAFEKILKYHKEDENGKVYIVFNHKASAQFKNWLFQLLVDVIAVALIQFWEQFLLRESRICITSPGLSCFPVYPKMNAQQLDCSNTSYLEENNITSVICYRFAYRLGPAAGSAIGIITMTAVAVFLFIWLMFCCSDKTIECKHQKCLLKGIQIAAALVALVVIFVSGLLIVGSSSSSLKQVTAGIKYFLIAFMVPKNILYFSWLEFEKKDPNYLDLDAARRKLKSSKQVHVNGQSDSTEYKSID